MTNAKELQGAATRRSSESGENAASGGRPLVFAWNYLNWGGAQIYFLSIIKRAVQDWNVLVLLPKGSSPDFLLFLDAIPVKYELLEFAVDDDEAPTLFRKLQRQIRRIRSEIELFWRLKRLDLPNAAVHIDIAPWQSWVLLYLLARRGNVFVTLHNALQSSVPMWRRMVWKFRLNLLVRMKGFHLYAANQDSINSVNVFLDKNLWDSPILTRAAIDPRQIDEALRHDNGDLRAKNGLPSDRFIVLGVGRFIERKGRHIFLEAAKILRELGDDILFVWVGPERPDPAAQEMIGSFGLGDSFRFIRSSDVGSERIDILRFFTVADVFALPSLWEGLPIAVLEAMALGIPVISTRINAIPEAVIHHETGILIEPRNSQALAETVLLLKNDPELRNRLARRGRKYAVENFDDGAAADIALRSYSNCFRDSPK